MAITGGTLQDNGAAITIENSFNLGGTITFSSPGAGSLTLDGSSLSPAPATVALTADTTLVVDNTTTINDAISGSGFGINTSGGTGTLILGGANTFTGGTTINASSGSSVVRLTNPNALQNSVVTLNDTSGIAFNAGIGGVAFGGLNGSVNLTLQDSAAAPISLTLGNNAGNNASYSGNLTGGISLAKTGANTQTLSGNNTFTGGLTVSGGLLSLSGNNTFSAAANAITISGGTLRVSPSQSGNSPLGTSPIALSGGTLQFQPASSIGVHFGTDQDLGAYALPAGTSAGVIPMNNWNNAPGANGSNTNITGPIAGSLATNAGTAAGGGATTVSWSSGSTFSFGGATAGFTGDNLLMGSFTNTGTTTVNFTGIPYSSYEVIAYVGNEGANGRIANISIGGTTYYYSTDTIHTGSGAFAYIPITNTNSASNPGGNYAVFTGLTGDSFTATLNQVGNSGLDGIEIIDQSIPISLPNTVNISNSSTIDLGGYANVEMNGPATIGNATLTVQSSNPRLQLEPGEHGRRIAHRQPHVQCNLNRHGRFAPRLVERQWHSSHDRPHRRRSFDPEFGGNQPRARHGGQCQQRHVEFQCDRRIGYVGHGECRWHERVHGRRQSDHQRAEQHQHAHRHRLRDAWLRNVANHRQQRGQPELELQRSDQRQSGRP